MTIDYEPFRKIFEIIGKDRSNIIVINNFIEKDDLLEIQKYLETHRDDNEFMGGKDLRYENIIKENKIVAELLKKYEKRTYEVIKENFIKRYNIKVLEKPENPTHFVKWVPGMSSKLHSDCEKPDGSPAESANFFKYNLSVLMYPNNDYIGGAISFPEYGITLKPNPGDFILFPGNSAYKHTVTNIEQGVRYTMPSWFAFDIGKFVSSTEEGREYSYKDSVQLWEGQKVNPVGPGYVEE